MGLFDKLLSKLTGGTALSPSTLPAAVVQPRTNTGITVTITGPSSPSVQISDTEVAERVHEHAFVLTTDPPALKTADQWWNEDAQKRRRREGSEKAYAWLLPFVPVEIAKLKQLQAAQEWGAARRKCNREGAARPHPGMPQSQRAVPRTAPGTLRRVR